jgi:hypothetical protein
MKKPIVLDRNEASQDYPFVVEIVKGCDNVIQKAIDNGAQPIDVLNAVFNVLGRAVSMVVRPDIPEEQLKKLIDMAEDAIKKHVTAEKVGLSLKDIYKSN